LDLNFDEHFHVPTILPDYPARTAGTNSIALLSFIDYSQMTKLDDWNFGILCIRDSGCSDCDREQMKLSSNRMANGYNSDMFDESFAFEACHLAAKGRYSLPDNKRR
jgi:hypothetical protein